MSFNEQESSITHKVLTVIGTILCIILTPVLIINCTLIIKSLTKSDEVPKVAGYCPMIVLTDSMYPLIQSGDLIICQTIDAEAVEASDVIAFFDPAGSGTSIVTHRVVEVIEEGNTISFRTKGDANNAEDSALVPADNLVGIYKSRIPSAGNIAMFMQTTQGLIICVIVPIIALVLYDVIRRRHYEKQKQDDTAALLAELEELRAQKAANDK